VVYFVRSRAASVDGVAASVVLREPQQLSLLHLLAWTLAAIWLQFGKQNI